MALTLQGTQSSLWQHQIVRPRIPAAPITSYICLSSSRRLPSLRCNAQGEHISSFETKGLKSTPLQLSQHPVTSFVQTYAVSSPLESGTTLDDFFGGVLKLCTGMAIFVGFTLMSHSMYSTKGIFGSKNRILFLPVAFQRQQELSSSFMGSADPEETPTTTHELNVVSEVFAETPLLTAEVVTDIQQPITSGQGISYYQVVADAESGGCLLSTAAATQFPIQGLELKEDSSSNAPPDPTLAGSSKYGKEEQSEQVSKDEPRKVLVPALTDPLQEQALAALQRLKVIEADIEAGNICSKREYARWLITASQLLSRSSARKLFPAMYIEGVSELAFDDVLPDDPDFPFIQGLAEAGLISSRLLATNDNQIGFINVFLPDSPLSRQDLVSWKIALDCLSIPQTDNESLGAMSRFIDLEKIHKDAIPALAVDSSAGDLSIVAKAFGFTRRFQPEKPVTAAQAAVALTNGEAKEHVAEELARLEAETVAEVAVATQIVMEAHAKTKAYAEYIEVLEEERKHTAEAQSLVEALRLELDTLKSEREEEKCILLRDRAAMESEKELVLQMKIENQGLVQELSNEKAKVAFEKQVLERLVTEAELEKLSVTTVQSELEVEKKALTLARLWAEDEANRARALARILEEARKRWENNGIEVHVDQELDENNIPSMIWTYDHKNILPHTLLRKPYHLILVEKAEEIKEKCKEMMVKLLEVTNEKFTHLLQIVFEALQDAWRKSLQVQQAFYCIVTTKTSEFALKTCEVQNAATSVVAGFSAQIVGSSKNLAEALRGGKVKAG